MDFTLWAVYNNTVKTAARTGRTVWGGSARSMIYDLQKANMWKRISAFLFDGILLGILAVLFAWLLSMVLHYDRWNNTLNDAYTRYGEEYGVAFDISLSEYEALSPEELDRLNAAYKAVGEDAEAVRAYNVLIQLTLVITSFSLLKSANACFPILDTPCGMRAVCRAVHSLNACSLSNVTLSGM